MVTELQLSFCPQIFSHGLIRDVSRDFCLGPTKVIVKKDVFLFSLECSEIGYEPRTSRIHGSRLNH